MTEQPQQTEGTPATAGTWPPAVRLAYLEGLAEDIANEIDRLRRTMQEVSP